MSLTATLLLGKTIILPDGVKQPPHYLIRPESRVVVKEGKYEKRRLLREANIARVLAAIEEGVDTTNAVAEHLGLSKSTVLKAVNRLQARGQIKGTTGRNGNGLRVYFWRTTP